MTTKILATGPESRWLASFSAANLTASQAAVPPMLGTVPEPELKPISRRRLVTLRQGWAVALGKFFTDPFWYVYLFWMPDFLSRNLKLDLRGMALPLLIIYTDASMGSVAGGWLSSALIKMGWELNTSRKASLLVCALAVMPIMLAARTRNAWLAVFSGAKG